MITGNKDIDIEIIRYVNDYDFYRFCENRSDGICSNKHLWRKIIEDRYQSKINNNVESYKDLYDNIIDKEYLTLFKIRNNTKTNTVPYYLFGGKYPILIPYGSHSKSKDLNYIASKIEYTYINDTSKDPVSLKLLEEYIDSIPRSRNIDPGYTFTHKDKNYYMKLIKGIGSNIKKIRNLKYPHIINSKDFITITEIAKELKRNPEILTWENITDTFKNVHKYKL